MCEFCGCGMKSTVAHSLRRPKATERLVAIRAVALPGERRMSPVRTTTPLPDKGSESRGPTTRRG